MALPCFFNVLCGACAVLMLENGRKLLFFSTTAGAFSEPSPFLLMLPRGPSFSYAWNGFLNTLWLLAGALETGGIGETCLLLGAGWKFSSSTLTKLLGNRPMARGSRRKRPIHHWPSPALRASIRSPSMKPKSFFVSPPHE